MFGAEAYCKNRACDSHEDDSQGLKIRLVMIVKHAASLWLFFLFVFVCSLKLCICDLSVIYSVHLLLSVTVLAVVLFCISLFTVCFLWRWRCINKHGPVKIDK